MTTHLLLNEKPLMVLPSLAKLLGINASIAVQHIHWIIEIKHENQDDRTDYDGFTWCKYSLTQWQAKMCWMSIDGIQKMLTKLEADGAIISCKPDAKSRNQTKWYRVDLDGLNRLSTKSISDSVQTPISDSVQNESLYSVQNDLYQKDLNDLNKNKVLPFSQNLSEQNKSEDIPTPPIAPRPPAPVFDDPMGDRFRDAGNRTKQVDEWLKNGEFLKFMHKLIKRTEYYKTSTNITDAKNYIRKAKIQSQDKAVFYESLCDHYQDFLDQQQRSQQQTVPQLEPPEDNAVYTVPSFVKDFAKSREAS